ncbi:gamma-glutamyl cyclotransferase family protein [Haloferula helveola]|uniref:Gamma-glutamylcyclotransferase family protein n=1 Tax=Haloferula helveola TaxID=490095 RepID=A0ABN6HEF3_9BACT|nr:gamma-glutamyl cyclotransferase family protein [Haloferula helveola]
MNPKSHDTDGELVFVYGTLRRGASNAHRLDGAEYLGSARVGGHLYRVSWYPAFVPATYGDDVIGEVWKVSGETLAELDQFEGLSPGQLAGEEYERRKLPVTLTQDAAGAQVPGTRRVNAWIWVWVSPAKGLTRIPTGDWLYPGSAKAPILFTSVGCVGVIAIPIGGASMIVLAADNFALPSDIQDRSVWIYGGLLLGAGLFGTFSLILGERRGEKVPILFELLCVGSALCFAAVVGLLVLS